MIIMIHQVDALAIKDQLQKFSESKSEMERHFETNTKADFVNNCSELIYVSLYCLLMRKNLPWISVVNDHCIRELELF